MDWNQKPRGSSKSPHYNPLVQVAKLHHSFQNYCLNMPACYTVIQSKKRNAQNSYPWATITPQPWRLGVITIKELHVVIATVRLLLDFKGLEDELHAVAFLRRDNPLTVRGSGVVVVPKLGMREQVLGFDLSLKMTSTLCGKKVWAELWVLCW